MNKNLMLSLALLAVGNAVVAAEPKAQAASGAKVSSQAQPSSIEQVTPSTDKSTGKVVKTTESPANPGFFANAKTKVSNALASLKAAPSNVANFYWNKNDSSVATAAKAVMTLATIKVAYDLYTWATSSEDEDEANS